MKNHPNHRTHWQQYVNELMGKGTYGIKSQELVMKCQAEFAQYAMEASRAANIYMKGGLHDKAFFWREWSNQLRIWIKQLNGTA